MVQIIYINEKDMNAYYVRSILKVHEEKKAIELTQKSNVTVAQ